MMTTEFASVWTERFLKILKGGNFWNDKNVHYLNWDGGLNGCIYLSKLIKLYSFKRLNVLHANYTT